MVLGGGKESFVSGERGASEGHVQFMLVPCIAFWDNVFRNYRMGFINNASDEN